MADGTLIKLHAEVTPWQVSHTWNVLGKIAGNKADQIILLSAHLDHLGVKDGKTYPGADDDASGTVAVMELARTLAKQPRPQRTIVFALWGSEEVGLVGARYFLKHPTIELKNLVANLEFEMIARPDPKVQPIPKAVDVPRKTKAVAAADPPEVPSSCDPILEQEVAPTAILRGLSYERAAMWIVAQLADGLQHAHQRGILHRDIKPSNVLMSAEGQALLLDFNLSPAQDEDPAHAAIGGTVAYMAPEHLRALVGRTPALIRQVDRRSDIYSLGIVLAEMLTGQHPFDQSGSYGALPRQIEAMARERSQSVPSLRQERSDVSWGLESIVRKCLA